MRIADGAWHPAVFATRAIVQDEHADAHIIWVTRIRTYDCSPFLVISQLPLQPQARIALILAFGELIIPVWAAAHAARPVALCAVVKVKGWQCFT